MNLTEGLSGEEQDLKIRAEAAGYQMRVLRHEHNWTEYRLARHNNRLASSDVRALCDRLDAAPVDRKKGRMK